MTAKSPGAATREFMKKGFGSFVPKGAVSKAAAVALLLGVGHANAGLIGTARAPDTVQAQVSQSAGGRMTTADVLADQAALRRIVREAARAVAPVSGYSIPDFDRVVMTYVGLVNDLKSNDAQAAAGGLYGVDDGMWAWMMRNHAANAGLSSAMDGITINEDGSIDAKSATKLAAMLDLRRDPEVATKVFAAWLASEIASFDGNMGRAPTIGEMTMIALTDSERALNAAFTAQERPSTKLGPELGIRAGNWKRPLFVNSRGWMAAKDVMVVIEAKMEARFKDAFAPIKVRRSGSPVLDEDYVTADLRKDPDRFARIVLNAAAEMPEASRETLGKTLAAAGTDVDAAGRLTRLGATVVAMTATIDEIRGKDVSGGIYTLGEGQWIAAVEAYGDPDFKESFMAGIKLKRDGSVRAASADQFGAFMRLRENAPIATQIVLAKTVAAMDTLRRGLGRLPSGSEILVSHLFGVAAAESFARAADRSEPFDALRFSRGDPRNEWAAPFAAGGPAMKNAADLRRILETASEKHGREIKERIERHADAAPVMKP